MTIHALSVNSAYTFYIYAVITTTALMTSNGDSNQGQMKITPEIQTGETTKYVILVLRISALTLMARLIPYLERCLFHHVTTRLGKFGETTNKYITQGLRISIYREEKQNDFGNNTKWKELGIIQGIIFPGLACMAWPIPYINLM